MNRKPLCKIIDVSDYQGSIDWKAVAASGVTGVMVKVGWAGYKGSIKDNAHLGSFEKNYDAYIRGAHAAGLDVGLYVYAYTDSPAAARIAAREMVEIAKRYPGIINLPIAFDVEFDGRKKDENGNTIFPDGWDCLIGQGKKGLAATIKAFLDEVFSLKYYGCWYSYAPFIAEHISTDDLKEDDLWLANYAWPDERIASVIPGLNYNMRQYAGDSWAFDIVANRAKKVGGTCPGVKVVVDLNHCYVDYPLMISQRLLNGLFWNPPTGGAEAVKTPSRSSAAAGTIQAGSVVKVKAGTKTYTGGSLASFVYSRDHAVKEVKGDRAVITYGGTVVAAMKVSDLTFIR